MVNVVNKAPSKRFWVVHDAGPVFFYGETNPGLVTDTGQPSFRVTPAKPVHINNLKDFANRLPPIPGVGQRVRSGQFFKNDDDPDEVLEVLEDHTIEASNGGKKKGKFQNHGKK